MGLFPALAGGGVPQEMTAVLALTDRLKSELPQMLEEHNQIVEALNNLISAAMKARKPRYARFAEKLMAQARVEAKVSYPASILIGEYIKLKLAR